MRVPNQVNLEMVRLVAQRLRELREKVVFLGGAVADLLITDPAAPSVRPTKDVDVIVEVASRQDYYRLRDSLISLGFKEDQDEDAPLCRWRIDDIKVDVMPTETDILGFSNQWYRAATETATTEEITEGLSIRLVTAPLFLATKIEAFKGRGLNDFMASHDMEDVIAVLDGRPEVIDEIKASPYELQEFLAKTFRSFLKNDEFLDSLYGHLPPDNASQERVPILMDRIKAIADLS